MHIKTKHLQLCAGGAPVFDTLNFNQSFTTKSKLSLVSFW
jgi:hypothetical protein